MALFDGDRATNACSITADSNAAGRLDIELKDAHVITEVNVYLIGTEPDAKTVELRDAFHGETAQHYRYPNQITAITSGAQTIWRATLRWYNRTTLLECFTAQQRSVPFAFKGNCQPRTNLPSMSLRNQCAHRLWQSRAGTTDCVQTCSSVLSAPSRSAEPCRPFLR